MKTFTLSVTSHAISARMVLTLLAVILLGGVAQAQGQWATTGNDINSTNTGKVGIGPQTPSAKLDVQIANAIGDGIKVTDAGAAGKYLYMGDGSGNSGVFAPYIAGVSGTSWGLVLEGGVPTDSASIPAVSVRGNIGGSVLANSPIFTVATTSGSELFRVGATGNVGIGTASFGSWASAYKLVNIGTTDFSIAAGSSSASYGNHLTEGAYYDGANWRYTLGSSPSSNIYFSNGTIGMRVAPGGSAGSPLTWTNGLLISNNGNVGVGTMGPVEKLQVDSSAANTHVAIRVSNSAAVINSYFLVNNNSAVWGSTWTGAGMGTGSAHPLIFATNASERMRIDSSGNVGIGTTTPTAKLEVQGGTINASGGLCIAGDCKTAWSQVGGGSSQWTPSSSNIYYNSGNVGIGTATPSVRLESQMNSVYPAFNVQEANTTNRRATIGFGTNANWNTGWVMGQSLGYDATKDFYLFDVTAGATRLFINTSGNVGLGTSSPSGQLEVKSGTSAHNSLYLNTTTAGFADSLIFQEAGTIKASIQHNPASLAGGLLFNTNGGSSPANTRMVIDSSGRVGIGNPNPTKTLDVSGDTKVSGALDVTGTITGGTINAKYQDVAEWVPATHNIPAGTVVVLNPTQSNQVMAAAKAYDTRVAGVVSARPGLTLGEAGADKVLVATTGRVRVKVDATRASISVGDLLVTSDQEGLGMKSVPVKIGEVEFHRPGTLIGKALEPLEKGKGEILVLLSLQ